MEMEVAADRILGQGRERGMAAVDVAEEAHPFLAVQAALDSRLEHWTSPSSRRA
jgi:hypothetical protein